ncbi:MAG TPA: DUF1800 domain-containing protein [Actinophytocola sp.]|uniref:DUF1800 domain-containing protein n=1 Tax=Actinophytocola sp. TaxID=1872138 RepID=UPI002DDCD0BC|nr:DUF1800 domain-containing protein [Actinophytocola sp.]HEV2783093.1 DUF1800 domain-containing protein [Actinophytocola sp.]
MAPLSERAAVRRLLDRFGFGPRPGEPDAAGGFDRAADALLSATDDPAAPAPPALAPEPKPGKDKQARRQAQEQLRLEQAALTVWWLDRMVAAGVPLVERLTWFWHGHFATSAQKVRSARLMLAQNQTLRRLGLGDFAVLAKAMAVDPAMLIWLDGQKNTAKAANENLARELMELFTLGVGNYTEQDVREGARALTGWKVDRNTITASLAGRQHDAGAKTVLGHTGALDAASLVDVLVAQPASPRFVAQRLWFRLVSTAPADDDALGRLVAAYGPGRDVRGLLRAITAEPGFRDERSTLVKQPVEWAVGLMRALRIRPSALPEADRTKLLAGLRGMGQVPFLPPSVGGWPSGGAWLTTSAALARLQVARLLTAHADLSALSGRDPVAAAGALFGVDGWSERTAAALRRVAGQPAQLATVAAVAPEYVVSG